MSERVSRESESRPVSSETVMRSGKDQANLVTTHDDHYYPLRPSLALVHYRTVSSSRCVQQELGCGV